jgi:hypothetical protein
MTLLLKRFIHIFIKEFRTTIFHDVFARVVELVMLVIVFFWGVIAQHWESVVALIWGVGLIAVYHAFKSAHTVCTEVVAQIREHKGQTESLYIFTPSGTHASLSVSAPVLPRRHRTILYGAACAVSLLSIFADVLAWQWSRKTVSHERVAEVPAIPPIVEQPLRVFISVATRNVFHFWLVRNDVKQYFPTDIFMMMRFTNLTNKEILVDSLKIELIGRFGEPPLRINSLPAPDESWHTYCGPSRTFVLPCDVDNRGFLLDVLRQPIPAGHTVYAVGLFQVPQGRDLAEVSGLNLHIIEVTGNKYDIGAIIPTASDSGSLEQSTIRNGHPPIDISAYSEQRPLYPD